MRRLSLLLLFVAIATLAVSPVLAGNPHFIKVTIVESGLSLTATGKEAGLGNEDQVHIELMAEAQCINPGGHNPAAGNKESFSVGGDFPVQNGKAVFSLTLTPTFKPDCTPPMSVEFLSVQLCDTTHGICE